MQQLTLKIISLNIEMDAHFERILPFINEEQPDVILFQEVLGKDKAFLEEVTGMTGIYTIQNIIELEKAESFIGLLTLTKLPILNQNHVFYRGNNLNPIRMTKNDPDKMARVVTMVEVRKENQTYLLLNTHFTWTANAEVNEMQRQDLPKLFAYLDRVPEFILCGDFNAPRGKEIFDTIATKYRDNMPSYVTTTIDKQWHRAGDLGIVVDGVFTTSGYRASSVEVRDGLSDHCAIIATVYKV